MSAPHPPPCNSCQRWLADGGGGCCRICSAAIQLTRLIGNQAFTADDFGDLSSQLTTLVGEYVVKVGTPDWTRAVAYSISPRQSGGLLIQPGIRAGEGGEAASHRRSGLESPAAKTPPAPPGSGAASTGTDRTSSGPRASRAGRSPRRDRKRSRSSGDRRRRRDRSSPSPRDRRERERETRVPEPALPPRYYRQVLMGKVQSKPMLREMLTISCVLDELVGGQVLQAADLLAQRLKSLELMAAGATAEVATQVEIVPKELTGLATQAESRLAKKEATADLKLSRALKGKGKADPPVKGDPKGKSKGGKGKKSQGQQVRRIEGNKGLSGPVQKFQQEGIPGVTNTFPSEIPGGHSSLDYKSYLAEVSSSHGRPNAEDERCEDSHEARTKTVFSWGIW
eukprot:symbB.v1.2.037352.t1/scaffold5493.1/size26513/2